LVCLHLFCLCLFCLLVLRPVPVPVLLAWPGSSAVNGWPIGVEALQHGALLFATDELNQNERDGVRLGDEFTRIRLGERGGWESEAELRRVVRRLRAYAANRSKLLHDALATQRRVLELTSPAEYARLTFGYLEERVAARGAGRSAAPPRRRWGD
jgi:hypothetical protein